MLPGISVLNMQDEGHNSNTRWGMWGEEKAAAQECCPNKSKDKGEGCRGGMSLFGGEIQKSKKEKKILSLPVEKTKKKIAAHSGRGSRQYERKPISPDWKR